MATLTLSTTLRSRFNGWLAARLKRTDSLLLSQHNVYILPTRAGWMMAVTLMVLLVASINYQLNLGYLLTFLLAGCAVVGMHVSHANLRGLTLKLLPPPACFAGAPARLTIGLDSTRKHTRHGINLLVSGQPSDVWVDVPAWGSATAEVTWLPPARGHHELPALQADTRFPMGLFRVWTVWRPAAKVWVYPTPEMHAPALPPGEPVAHGTTPAQAVGTGEFDGVRAYRRGDALKTIVWKRAAQAMARGSADLISREQARTAAHHQTLWLDWQHTQVADTDLRIARLTAWVLKADQQGLSFGLRLPSLVLPPDQGPAHTQRCLEALALC
ncbi:MAG: DUF58 domain-containing protein [Burkholderiales bacterium]|nr:DUF58 domain-containing protein [Burkholderiales bacterium]